METVIILSLTGIILGTITSRSFWAWLKVKLCKHCHGTGLIYHIGEGIEEPCEHCYTPPNKFVQRLFNSKPYKFK